MINGLGVVGWGVGGIEAEACMLGQPISMLLPEVVGFKLTASLPEGAPPPTWSSPSRRCCARRAWSANSSSSTAPAWLRCTVADRATIANMAPEYGATIGFFPIDHKTLDYLRLTNRAAEQIALVEAYAKEQGLFRTDRIARSRILRHARTRSQHRRAIHGRPQASAGSHQPS